ncbi:MAG: amidohydrolase family protein [Desulfovibrionaceae bacterium]
MRLSPTPPDAPGPAPLYLRGRVWRGRADGGVASGHCVLCRDGRIAAVARAAASPPPPGVAVIDCGDGCIMPGLINAHMHGAHDATARRNAFLPYGVTTVCDMGAPLDAMPALGQAHDPAGRPAGRCLMAGPVLTAPGGYPGPRHGAAYALEVADAHTAREAVRLLAARGARVVKMAFEPGCGPRPWPMLDAATARAVVTTAHGLGLPVRAHVEDLAQLPRALDAGVDGVEHVPARYGTGQARAAYALDQEYARLLRRMVDQRVTLTPTLSAAVAKVLDNGPLLAVVAAFHAMGGVVAMGTDYPSVLAAPGTPPGMPRDELELLVRAGLSPAAALEAATRGAARACGMAGRLGELAPGMAADIIVAAENPLADVGALRTLTCVIAAGEPVSTPAAPWTRVVAAAT